MIPRPDLVRQAVALLRPGSKDRAPYESAVRIALQEVEDFRRDARWAIAEYTGSYKKKVRGVYSALRNLHSKLNALRNLHSKFNAGRNVPYLNASPGSADDLLRMFPLDKYLSATWHRLIDLTFDPDDWLPQWRDRAEAQLRPNAFKIHLEADVKRFAAERAFDLRIRFEVEISAQKKTSDYCKLTALLCRSTPDGVRWACRETIASRNKEAKAV